jgi:hypothetical protein
MKKYQTQNNVKKARKMTFGSQVHVNDEPFNNKSTANLRAERWSTGSC